MAFQLVGIFDGTREDKTALRTRYRPVAGAVVAQATPVGSLPASLPDSPGAGGNLVLLGVGVLIGAIAGVWICRRKR